jgi:tetratricopeptide (TPR) repeat protein
MRASWLLILLASLGALAAASSLDEQKRRDAEKAYRRGEELARAESFEEAASYFRQAIKLDPLLSIAYYSLGQTQMALRRYPAAIEAYQGCRQSFERIAALDVGDRNALEKARQDEIRELRDSLVRVQQGKIKGATLSQEMGIEERLKVLEGAQMKGNDERGGVPAEVMLALGSAYFRNGQLPEAEPAYKEAVATDAKLGPAYSNLAVIYMMTSRFADAKDAVKRAEKAGFPINPALKKEIDQREKAAAK